MSGAWPELSERAVFRGEQQHRAAAACGVQLHLPGAAAVKPESQDKRGCNEGTGMEDKLV